MVGHNNPAHLVQFDMQLVKYVINAGMNVLHFQKSKVWYRLETECPCGFEPTWTTRPCRNKKKKKKPK